MSKKEYLTEENYEKGKKTLAKIIKIVLIVGFSISALLIAAGVITIVTSNNTKQDNSKEQVVQESTDKKEEINNDIAELNAKISELNQKLPALKAEKNAEFSNAGFSQKYYELDSQISSIEEEIKDLKMEKSKLNFDLLGSDINSQVSDDIIGDSQDEAKGLFKKGIGGILIFIGLAIIPPTLIISGVLFLFYKKREIAIFTTQQTMPIAQEGIEKMAPTIGNAVGTIGKDIAKGITSGIKEGKEDTEKSDSNE